MFNNIEYSKSYKAGQQVNETRDVAESHYVCQWWIQQFQGIEIENNSHTSIQFKKKHRDQIRLNEGELPFRRSGLWMTIKFVFHTILAKRLENNGTVVYKLLITHFLTYFICKTYLNISTELLVHCIRKIVRRLKKIECLLSRIDSDDVNQWTERTKQVIRTSLNKILPKSDWQKSIQINEKHQQLLMGNFELDHSKICQHLCQELDAYLKNKKPNKTVPASLKVNNHGNCTDIDEENYIPSIEMLKKKFNYTNGIFLTRIEIWVECCLEQWINRPKASESEKNRFETLLDFFETYQSKALDYYGSKDVLMDSMGYSRFILTSLTIIRSIHQKLCHDQKFERLQLHAIRIPNLIELFEFLVLPNREDMTRARDLYDYFREFSRKQYPDLLTDIESADAFGVYYASQSSTMNDTLYKIRTQAELDKQTKIQEVNDAKERYKNQMNSIKDLPCECEYNYSRRGNRYLAIQCERCRINEEAKNIQVSCCECPLPSKDESALAVIFELQMPIEIRHYRDIIWQFVNRLKPQPPHDMYEWLSASPHGSKLKPFFTGPSNCKVKLLSSTKSVTESHYSRALSIASTPIEGFLFENGLKVRISPTKSTEFKIEHRILTPQLVHPDYKSLQSAVNNTQFIQNHIIAMLSHCSPGIKPTQFVEFGSFRSGHRLQWWNLLTILEMDSLCIGEESVAILIIHSILQYGPLTTDPSSISCSWCSESHEQLLQDHFIDEFIARLDHRLNDCESNWENDLVLLITTMITMRIFTVCNSTKEKQVAQLIMKCRGVGAKWIDSISKTIQNTSCKLNDVIEFRRKLVNIGISCIFTFSTGQNRIDCLLSSNEHIVFLLKAATIIRDNIILNANQSNDSDFIKSIKRLNERILLTVQPKIAELLEKTSYRSLNDFAAIYWSAILTGETMNEKWQKRTEDSYDGWYDCRYQSRHLSIDCITGTFLVDGMTVGFLPEKLTTNQLYLRVFGNHVFEVQPDASPKTYITQRSYHGEGRVKYRFHFNDQTKRWTIKELHIQTQYIFQLIPHTCFQKELAETFVFNYSHWFNEKDQTVEFRPIRFTDSNFLNNKPYILSMKTGYITTTETISTQTLVNQSSTLFQNLFNRYFIRLDEKPYVYMLCSQNDSIINIHLARLGIAFEYNSRTKMIISREYSDMCIDENQWFGTLTGLTSGLLLSPLPVNNSELRDYPYRKLIVPFGTVQGQRNTDNKHQTVTIKRSSSQSDQYFVFILNDRLKILQSNDSPTGCLYLSLLHAMTSHPLSDEYTGMTGMEQAFQLLKSAASCSDQPFDKLSLNILGQIASMSPIVDYYPKHLTSMERIHWNSNGLPYSLQHFGYYLIAKKLIDHSQLFGFMHPSMILEKKPEIFQDEKYNEKLLEKLYWNYRDSYNPSARLSTEMENEIFTTHSTILYAQATKNGADITNYSVVRLLDDLYKDGNVNLTDCSNLNWFPLSQWFDRGKQLKNLFIGLLQLANRFKTEAAGKNTDNIQRFECLLNFLHYISKKCQIKPYYLQILRTTLKVSNIPIASLLFPPFNSYVNITQISVQETYIPRGKRCVSCQKNLVLAEVNRCWKENCQYPDDDDIATSTEKNTINRLLNSWRSNRNLRLFLEAVQILVSSVPIEQFHKKISYVHQQFSQELLEDHYQIQVKSSNNFIDRTLLSSAEQKFHHFNSDHLYKQILTNQNIDKQKAFPQEIFPSINDQEIPLSELTDYFQTHLKESWEKFLSEKQYQTEYPSIEQMIKYRNSFREESTKFLEEFSRSIRSSYEQLFQIGLVRRLTPSNLICLLQEKDSNSQSFLLTKDQYTLLGGILVNWTLEQQMERALYFASHDKMDDFRKELSHTPHSNWIPSENLSWLILELEMNITIREMQIKVANHMIKPNLTTSDPKLQNIVMQMNMGEGKTSVILPMLSAYLSSFNSSLVRIIVLKSLLPTNYQSLRCKLGGLLNRRIFPFACRRDMNFSDVQIKQIVNRLEQGLRNGDVILTSPEDILSFDLLTIDKCRQKQFDVARSMLSLQRWLKEFVRDILDESDEILHVKYQLVYTVGAQQQVDGGAERWTTIQSILELVKKHAANISKKFSEDVSYQSSERKSGFPHFRFQSSEPFSSLSQMIANDWLDSTQCRKEDKQDILSFILETDLSVKSLVNKFSQNDIQQFLILRGLLSSEVLLVALKKRYRVNYGVNPSSSFIRLMSVPFRAKDVAADKTEFGHPDVALVLTQLCYYYSGLNNDLLTKCFNRLNEEESDPASIYDQWILYEQDENIHVSIKQWRGINLKDYQQRTDLLYPTLRYNMLVINYFLNHFVFPREAKQFPYKLIASPWDLSASARSKIITGFSGTNDTQLLLPTHISQYDLPELKKTDAIVVNNILQSENDSYQSLAINATSNEILNQIINSKEMVNVILDVGALFIDGTNKKIAVDWLTLSDKNKIDYAVYFHFDSIFVCDRQYHHDRFETSPASERLDRCVFYLDDIHTRGTDFKFPQGFRAAVTLGNGLTKDRFVQACMRMRKLGHGHSLTFFSSNEVHQQIRKLKTNINDQINLIDILRWVYENTVLSIWDGFHHWSSQSLSFQRKVVAFEKIDWKDHEQSFTDTIMEKLAEKSLEPEMIELIRLYGPEKMLRTVEEIYYTRRLQINHRVLQSIHKIVSKRLTDYGGTKERLIGLLDEEQQRELQQELEEEERQVEHTPRVTPYECKLHPEIKKLSQIDIDMNLSEFPSVFQPLPYAFTGTTFYNDCQPDSWKKTLWISTEFQQVIATEGEYLNPFLRPPRWIIVYRNQHIIFVNALEANHLMGHLRSSNSSTTTLRLLLPHIKRIQSISVNIPTLTIPPSVGPSNSADAYYIPIESLVQLFVFNGSLYFETLDEQTAYCKCLGLCPKPRTEDENDAFEKGWIAVDGFVAAEYRHHLQMSQAQFVTNPLLFIKKLIEVRNNSRAPIRSHVGSIVHNSLKCFQP
ncbi:unnamed protein product [Adineta steineri]|uniref:ubiquitinyl hydrolase 1 n=1 Tax=Adineta steineri TaxID=433720 RepID=A0A814GDQ5_9BILA|nr:unnamed protein product [Adineta steineri]CAF4000477.1 unnamed protein product [Adineta steineri]